MFTSSFGLLLRFPFVSLSSPEFLHVPSLSTLFFFFYSDSFSDGHPHIVSKLELVVWFCWLVCCVFVHHKLIDEATLNFEL